MLQAAELTYPEVLRTPAPDRQQALPCLPAPESLPYFFN